jgi:hypothetical protein
MIKVAKVLIVVAFLAGAYLASLDRELVNWFYFIPVMMIGAVGVILLKRGEKAAASDSSVLSNDKAIMHSSLNNILNNLHTLNERKSNIPTYEMRFEIDRMFREDLNNFADSRESMKHLFGLMAYADIMSSFAAGERYLNRVWSASTDGYIDEVLRYVEKARDQFEHAQEEWHKADSIN